MLTCGSDSRRKSGPNKEFGRRISWREDHPKKRDLLLIYRFPARVDRAGICEIYEMTKVYSGMGLAGVIGSESPVPDSKPSYTNCVQDMRLLIRLTQPITYSQMGEEPAIRNWAQWRACFRAAIPAASCQRTPRPCAGSSRRRTRTREVCWPSSRARFQRATRLPSRRDPPAFTASLAPWNGAIAEIARGIIPGRPRPAPAALFWRNRDWPTAEKPGRWMRA